ncbi:Barwin domain-containing protein [Cephalotus follicularis]|uniref:Barwin domain-containing protein n=1 Tax=Cephalotus follicularis TaxID=3775 RepID=A0A1Q3C661_CEPFO|nr:Barwin domain-containing protein [Cephalotus follicularis]
MGYQPPYKFKSPSMIKTTKPNITYKMGKVSCLCIAVVFVYLVASVIAKESTDSDTNVVAYWSDYDPPANDWDFAKVGVACSSQLEGMPLELRSKYDWTGFCGKYGPQNLDACGRCVLVTNTRNGKQVKLRIVDTCGVNGLVMDLRPFDEIDDGTGHNRGHHIVDYEIVACGYTPVTRFITRKMAN